MAGLDPAIHVFDLIQDVDARHKAGHDDSIKSYPALALYQVHCAYSAAF